MNDTEDNSTRLNQFAGFLANNPDAVKNIAMIADMIKDYANQIVLHDLRDALNSDKDMKYLICEEVGYTNIYQRIYNRTSLIHEVINEEFGNFHLDISYDENSVQWKVYMNSRKESDARYHINKLREKDPQKYKNTPTIKRTLEDIMKHAKDKHVRYRHNFEKKPDNVNMVMAINIIGNKEKDVKKLKNILKDIITKMHD